MPRTKKRSKGVGAKQPKNSLRRSKRIQERRNKKELEEADSFNNYKMYKAEKDQFQKYHQISREPDYATTKKTIFTFLRGSSTSHLKSSSIKIGKSNFKILNPPRSHPFMK